MKVKIEVHTVPYLVVSLGIPALWKGLNNTLIYLNRLQLQTQAYLRSLIQHF